MAKKFRDLTAATMSKESRTRAAVRTKAMLAEVGLSDLRRARALSQEDLASRIGATQGEISKLERRADMYVSSLRTYIEAMGCQLEILARFPAGVVRINQFHEISDLRGA